MKRSLVGKIVAVMVSVSVVPLTIMGLLLFISNKTILHERSLRMLSAIRHIHTDTLKAFLHDAVVNAALLADYDRLKMAVSAMSSFGDPESRKPGNDSRERHILTGLSGLLSTFLERKEKDGYQDVLVIRADGEVIFSVKKLTDLGADVRKGEFKDSGLGNIWKKVTSTKEPAVTEFSMYKPFE